MNRNGSTLTELGARSSPRVQSLKEIAVSYEGQDEQIVTRSPNLSQRGMFISTSRSFPEGAVLNLRFSLILTNAEIRTRCEVRYCQPGVGIGVEFIGLSPEAMKVIEREIGLSTNSLSSTKAQKRKKKRTSQTPGRRRR